MAAQQNGKHYHKILDRQLKDFVEKGGEITPAFESFIEQVSKTYQLYERDKMLADHAFAVSEKEYQDVLQNLSEQNVIISQSVFKLNKAIAELDPDNLFTNSTSGTEIIDVIDFLEQQILKQKKLENELISAKEIAEKASRAKSEFLSVMSHEIRTPLNAIIGLSYIIMAANDLNPTQQHNIKTLHISAQNLLVLINDILDFNRIEEGRITLSETNVDLCSLIKNIRAAHNQSAQERGNKIRLMIDQDVPALVVSDEVRLNQVFTNLLSNAIKFTQNGQVTFEASVVSQTVNTVAIMFSVQDTGIGIAGDKLEMIFDKFTQADAEITRSFGGSGLGLSIVRKLLKLFHSDVSLESEIGKGSRFYFTIEFEKAQPGNNDYAKKDYTEPLTDFTGKRILLVEDVEFNILFAEQILKTWGVELDIAVNGREALLKASSTSYDLILMDLRMPLMDGFTATKEIRRFNTQIPIIALTASASAELLDRIVEDGFNDHVLKPFAPKDLNRAIGKALSLN
ncbi:response regulator [Panacibacter sp. DH6]|uniref:histidine kinase n=1 Tax=Panacibacter microcysteis TaxID=2793269 RepID=A0A931E3E3_9BACT|nr:ATP-binding protein [Panacibacter microcysteis]MBG9375392.1 response regulator [Panacibacter microcysteis]